MVYKKLIIFFFLFMCINANSEIIYHKKDIVVTNIDVDSYIELYEDNYGVKINYSSAIKDVVLIKNLLNYLEKNNKAFIDKINQKIISQYGIDSFENYNVRFFLSFLIIRDEFIIDYFQNDLVENEIINIFSKLEVLNLPISENNCLIIKEIMDLKNNNSFIENFYLNLKNNSKNFKVKIDKITYDVCIDQINFKKMENLIIRYIQSKTSKKFESFVYDKTEY